MVARLSAAVRRQRGELFSTCPLLLDKRSFELTSILTNHIQVSIWSRSHRVDLDEKKVSIEWEVSQGSITGGEGAAGSILWESDSAVEVYLTE